MPTVKPHIPALAWLVMAIAFVFPDSCRAESRPALSDVAPAHVLSLNAADTHPAWNSPWQTDAVTSIGSGSVNINNLVGAQRYYDHSISVTGQQTVTTNLEAGHIWNGHESLQHVTHFTQSADTYDDGNVASLMDRHATWAAMLIGGRETIVNPSPRQTGLAPGTDLRSAAIATEWTGNAYALGFDISVDSMVTAYTTAFAQSDVVNNSFGYTDSAAAVGFTIMMDGLAWEHSRTTHVASAGNNGPSSNTVGAPGSAYNSIAVAALGNAPDYDGVAGFSSRGPSNFLTYEGNDPVTLIGVRASVTLAAPGSSLTTAFYGGQSGGNNPSLTNSTDLGSNADAYTDSIQGTSFSAPIVAGGVALMLSAAKSLPELSANENARESVVIRSILMTSADKTSGWDNGQQFVTEDSHTFVRTTQALDWGVGAGRMNLDRAFDVQVTGQRGVGMVSPADPAHVQSLGWDYGWITLGTDHTYILDAQLAAGSTLTASLSWLRTRLFDDEELLIFDIAQANLQLSIWSVDGEGLLVDLIAESVSLYNNDEHLHIAVPQTGYYGLQVSYTENIFDRTIDQIWGSEDFPQDYGLAWYATIIPEPTTYALLAAILLFTLLIRRRKYRLL